MIKKYGIAISGLLIFLSRLPFLSAGYGSEEDAAGMVMTARHIAQSGVYEYSRLPGHPVSEMLYACISGSGPLYMNLVTAAISTAGIVFFMLALKNAGLTGYLSAGLALAFTPAVYIASTNVMDYTWAMAFILLSFYFIITKKPLLAGMALGIAIGCRITSAAMALPFLFMLYDEENKKMFVVNAFRFCMIAAISGIITFLPAINRYGTGFLDFYETIYPSFLKAFYKFTFAVYGTAGIIILAFIKIKILHKLWKRKRIIPDANRKLVWMSLSATFIYCILFWYLPQKAAFMIPAVPFIIVLVLLLAGNRSIQAVAICFFISCFFAGVNLSDANRGGKPSSLAFQLHAGNQEAVFDMLTGTVTDDYKKRKQRIAFAQKIISVTDTLHEKTVVIAGWWLGDIRIQPGYRPNKNAVMLYYAGKPELMKLSEYGYKIYYLPDQDFYNDERYTEKFTAAYASPWPWYPAVH
jgi:hypothetical protein